ncbi:MULTISPECIES: LacI family DNA-binding transcriptional regulator [Micromonospora]|uniref:LacI family DNA-binding transcriptional regulator n=1 Tax=Micromonospora TaxID=1873 RepID=UPI000B14D4A0
MAKAAGVSLTTASRVFADHPSVRPATRDRVLAAADDLGYVVNALAQAMMGLGRRTVAFVAAHMIGSTFADMAAGAESVATAEGNLFLLSTTGEDPARERDLMETLREYRPAAVLLAGSTQTGEEFEQRAVAYAEALAAVGARLVLVGHPACPGSKSILSVDYDQVGGVRRAVEHLVTGGHRRIAFLGLIPERTTPAERLRGYELGLQDAGLPVDPSLVIECANDSDGARVAALSLLSRPDRPTALVCLTDGVAVGVYRAARSLGLAIPGDVAIVGFDDAPIVADLTPALTTIRVPFWEVGVHGARVALGLEEYDGHVQLPTELIVRESSP